jgi:hypothetical protein
MGLQEPFYSEGGYMKNSYLHGRFAAAAFLLISGLIVGACSESDDTDDKYTITVVQPVSGGNFTVQVEDGEPTQTGSRAIEGQTVTLTAIPLDGFTFEDFTVNVAELHGSGYVKTFTMPPNEVTVTAEFYSKLNFHIYLGFGQSNMEGSNQMKNAGLTPEYTSWNNNRFRVLAAVELTSERVANQWYTAFPPLVKEWAGLCPADGFGRYLVENIRDKGIKIGVAIVAIPGAALDGFDKENYASYYAVQKDEWMLKCVNDYGGNPYGRLVELGKLAQEEGVIKGILMHQGESQGGKPSWGENVKCIYDNLLEDLDLEPDSVPLLAGQLLSNSSLINGLPGISNHFYVISSAGLTSAQAAGSTVWYDSAHFSPAGMMTLGRRYGEKMYDLLYKDTYGKPVTPP